MIVKFTKPNFNELWFHPFDLIWKDIYHFLRSDMIKIEEWSCVRKKKINDLIKCFSYP